MFCGSTMYQVRSKIILDYFNNNNNNGPIRTISVHCAGAGPGGLLLGQTLAVSLLDHREVCGGSQEMGWMAKAEVGRQSRGWRKQLFAMWLKIFQHYSNWQGHLRLLHFLPLWPPSIPSLWEMALLSLVCDFSSKSSFPSLGILLDFDHIMCVLLRMKNKTKQNKYYFIPPPSTPRNTVPWEVLASSRFPYSGQFDFSPHLIMKSIL